MRSVKNILYFVDEIKLGVNHSCIALESRLGYERHEPLIFGQLDGNTDWMQYNFSTTCKEYDVPNKIRRVDFSTAKAGA